jgi:surface polysaccharide O-acyltransferase-like enzyme
MLTLVYAFCYALTGLFLIATLWAVVESRNKQPSKGFMVAMNVVHYVAVLTFALGIAALARGELPQAGRFIEYAGLYTLGGVIYMRGLFPGGWVHKLLRDPPNIARGMLIGSGWAFGAMLGYVLRFVQGAA